ncbi:MAG: hypothetical protein Q9202_003375 [Teloschistes flavicans]
MGHGRYAVVFIWLALVLRVLSVPNVGIQQDWFEPGHDELYSFSAIMVFNANDDGTNPVASLSNGQLVALASKAYDEMTALPGTDKPGAMILLASANSLYFASSIKRDRANWLGLGTSDNARPEVLVQAAGGARIGASGHIRGGSCGEINVMALYHTWNSRLQFQNTASRIVAWGTSEGSSPAIFNPCSDRRSRYGCWTFLRAIANPDNPRAHLDAANLINIPRTTNPDTNFPDNLQFSTRYARRSDVDREDYRALCLIAESNFDPNHPDQRKRFRRWTS